MNRVGIFFWLLAMAGALSGMAPAAAQGLAPRTSHIAVSLTAEQQAVPAGGTTTLAIVMRPQSGWHGYWENPGDAGQPPRMAWRLPAGVEAGPLAFPVPERLSIAGLMNYVFKGDYAQLVSLRLPEGLAPGTRLPVRGTFDYLACTDEICVPERAEVAIDLTVAAPGVVATREPGFDGWRAALPRPLDQPARFALAEGRLRLAIPLPAAQAVDDPYFYSATERLVDYAAPQAVSRSGDLLIVETALSGLSAAAPERVEGVIALGGGAGLRLTAVPGDVPPAGTPVEADAAVSGFPFLYALLGALLGGLLLNIMPCVFPILSLKALSLARAGGDERRARREALAFAGGAVLMALALGGALLGLRAGGVAAGWAFQLQHPGVILVLLLLVTAIALGLAGLFRLPAITAGGALAGAGGTRGAFWTGALAAFIATPCTGPFMGAALGAALVLPAAAALAVFGGLGLGLALPFLLLGFVPALREKLPKPGPWMATFQRLLSIPMFATAFGLAWILGRQVGVDGMALGIASALALGLVLWWAGLKARPLWQPLAAAALVTALALALVPGVDPTPRDAPETLATEPFSEARLAALRAEGRPVFVYFTADWCLTCKVNERTVLDRADVAAAFARGNVAVLEGDWTTGDAAIGRFLESQGRSGVPLYLFYPAGGGAPEILPQILTPSRVRGLA